MHPLTPTFQVVTVPEAAHMWQRHPLTIRRALDAQRRRLVGRKSGGVWLITVDSLLRRWGDPVLPFPESDMSA